MIEMITYWRAAIVSEIFFFLPHALFAHFKTVRTAKKLYVFIYNSENKIHFKQQLMFC